MGQENGKGTEGETMNRIANRLVRDYVNQVNVSECNPYLIYYFFSVEANRNQVDKLNSLKSLVGNFNIFSILNEIEKRKLCMFRKLESDCYQIVHLRAKLVQNAVPGIGIESPYETGIRLHYIYGIPFIPSSAVKGSLSSYLKLFLDKGDKDDDRIRILGSQEKKGSVLFFDAYPLLSQNGTLLKLDIVTPHYQPYYAGENYPGDWFSPVPIPFLTIKKGVEFGFYIAARDINDLNTASDWLKKALQKVGVGAKTMTGFGHFRIIEG